MSNPASRHRKIDLSSADVSIEPDRRRKSEPFGQRRTADADLAVETAVVVNQLDRLIAGRVQDLGMLKEIAQSLKAGASKAEIHRKLLVLARSSREAFQSLQGSRDTLVGLHRKSSGGEIAPVVDGITGLPNRSSFDVRLEMACRRSAVSADAVLMLIEIGALQLVAQQAGEKVADRVLKRFATILRKTVKHTDFIARVSSSRFAIIFENMLPDGATPIAMRIYEAMQAQLAPGSNPVMQVLSVTVAIAGNRPEDASGDDLLQRAQDALVLARRQVGVGIYVA